MKALEDLRAQSIELATQLTMFDCAELNLEQSATLDVASREARHVTGLVEAVIAQAKRHMVLAPAVLLLMLLPAIGQAQSQCAPNASNAYTGQGGFAPRCGFNPYQEFASRVNSNGRLCANDGPLGGAQTVLTISEGTLGTPDHDLGYIIVKNPTLQAQQVVVELMFRGDNVTTYVQRLTLDGLSSATIDLTAQPIYFGCGPRYFDTNVYFATTGSAELKIYGLRDPSAPLSHVTTDKDGLPIPNARAVTANYGVNP